MNRESQSYDSESISKSTASLSYGAESVTIRTASQSYDTASVSKHTVPSIKEHGERIKECGKSII